MANVLLVTSNGTGMGHLTRQAAVALSMGEEDTATIFSLSLGLPLISRLGLRGEYCPSYDRPWIATRNWNSYLRDRLVAIAEEIGCEAILFDGVAPYPGLAMAARELREVAFIWLRRGMWKEANQRALAKGRFFDHVIEPGDLAAGDDHGPTSQLDDAVRVGPISILEPLPMLSREEARNRLNLPANVPVALVTLGSGMLGEVAGPGEIAVKTLLEKTGDWHVTVTKSATARNEVPAAVSDRLTLLRGIYPLATYLSAFDLAVSSAGYNAVHELMPAGVPSLLVANTSTRTDDQVRRARSLERQGLALSVSDTDVGNMATKLHQLLEDSTLLSLGAASAETSSLMTGASETADMIKKLGVEFEYRHRTPSELLGAGIQKTKDAVRGVMGDERTEDLKRLLRRSPTPIHERSSVIVVGSTGVEDTHPLQLAMVRALSPQDLRSNQPIEHLLDGSSDEYSARRLEIVNRYYDVVAD